MKQKHHSQPNRKEKAVIEAEQRELFTLHPQWILPTTVPQGMWTRRAHTPWKKEDLEEVETKKEWELPKL